MHDQQLFHCDVKPANILVDSAHHAILTDLGSCVHPEDADPKGRITVQFTWTYAHPKLTDLVNDPHGISGGGLKASAQALVADGLARFDLFALGRTIQETLAELVREFGERCYASYSFRFLHLIAALLLDGYNAPLDEKIRNQDGRRFIADAAFDYPVELFRKKEAYHR
jgi:serine/threonine protein kinase